MKRSYNTRQKAQILSYLEEHRDICLRARDIIDIEELNIGEATVYRCLSALTEEGKIKKFISEKNQGAYYQFNSGSDCENHFHLKCLSCGTVTHMDCHLMKDFEEHIKANHDFIVDNTKTVIYGICRACENKSHDKKINK